jgi:hypothetical protein
MLPAISLIIVQFRNRRTGHRRTFQIAEITRDCKPNVLLQYDAKKDVLVKNGHSSQFFNTLKLYTGYTDAEITREIAEKRKVIEYLVKFDVTEVDAVGRIIGEYYTNKENLMKDVGANKPFDKK